MYKSNLKACVAMLRSAAAKGCDAAAATYSTAIKRSLGGSSPSSPGSPPGFRSGRLQSAIGIAAAVQVDDAKTMVGIQTGVGGVGKTSPHLYGLFLEMGAAAGRPRPFRLPNGQWRTRKYPMLPRPFMRPAAESSTIGAAAFKAAETAAKKEIK